MSVYDSPGVHLSCDWERIDDRIWDHLHGRGIKQTGTITERIAVAAGIATATSTAEG